MIHKLLLVLINPNVMKFLKSPGCANRPYACHSKLKFEQYHLEIQYIYKVFHAIYKKFLTAIDHIDYHPSQQHNKNMTTRVKRSDFYTLYGHYQSPTRELTPSEEKFLKTFSKRSIPKWIQIYIITYQEWKKQVYLLGFWDGEYSQMQEVSLKLKTTYIFFKNKTNYRINK